MPHSPRLLTIFTCSAVGLLAGHVAAQQFNDESSTRFPNPDPAEYTNAVTIGDLDGDVDLDIVFANGGDNTTIGTAQKLRILINDSKGVFTDETDARTGGLTFYARGVELGDVDRDGDLDIIVAQDFNKQPTLLINNSKGIFTDETLSRLPIGTFSSNRAQFADVDNDGDLDIYLVNGGATNRWGSARGKLWLNDARGFFVDVTMANTPNQNIPEPLDCIFVDYDGDFDLDLRIASQSSNQSKLYRNNGIGSFTNVTGLPADANCYSYDTGDFDLDNDFDLLGANGNASTVNAEILLRNGGTGTFSLFTTWNGSTIDDRDSKFFDYDNDGDLDIFTATLASTERFYTVNTAVSPPTIALTNGVIQAIADSSLDCKVADLNGDGRYDIVTAQGESGSFVNRIYINNGPADTIPPTIVKTEQILDTMRTGGPYYARAIIRDAHTSDRGFHDKGVYLNYSLNDGEVQQVPMQWVGNSEWRGGIPGQKADSAISYYVTATDFAGNTGIGGKLTFTILHPPCPNDITNNGVVDVDDLLLLINSWGGVPAIVPITVQDTEFIPSVVVAHPGDTIQWSWLGGTHTVTSGSPCVADSKFNATITSLTPTFSYVIPSNPGKSIPYFCIPHCALGMTGTINIVTTPADINSNGVVDVDDLLAVINGWGACP